MTTRKSDAIVVLAMLLLIAGLASGCTVRESFVPTGPSAITQPTSVSVVVRAFLQSPHEPITGAIVSVDGHIRGTTDTFGELTVSVIADREVTITCTKDGMTALLTWARAAIHNDGEVWTFYFVTQN